MNEIRALNLEPMNGIRVLDDLSVRRIIPIFPAPVKIRILMICEGLAFDSQDGFSFKIMIDAIRDKSGVKFANFELTLASWGSSSGATVFKNPAAADYEATYENYRFGANDPDSGQLILDAFDEVWLFGITPGNNFAVKTADILASPLAPSNSELKVLHRWMNAGGGVLAMGDHASLGASLCARVPRVWTMRRWSEEDGAPPRITPERIDTNQPMWASQDPAFTTSPQMIPFDAQSDDVAQTIEVKRYHHIVRGWRPHPLLCGGKLGVIDRLPDHPHEGWCVDPQDLSADVLFPVDTGTNAREYPDFGGAPLPPEVIAWGHSSADPPLNLAKGPTTSRRFGIVGAYDGHIASVGRVVVDSTWHHWMSINLSGTYASVTEPSGQPLVGLKEANDKAYKQILQYYRNVAVWLAPGPRQIQMLMYSIWWSVFSYNAFEDWRTDTPVLHLGRHGRDVLGRATSDCFVHRWLRELLPLQIYQGWREFEPLPPPLPLRPNRPVLDDLQVFALGTLMRHAMKFRDELQQNPEVARTLTSNELRQRLDDALASTRKEVSATFVKHMMRERERLGSMIDSVVNR